MTTKIGILFLGLLLCLGCNKSAPDPRIAELEAEIKKLKTGVKTLDAAKKAMRELKKMDSVIEMGINYPNYTKTLLETKPAFDEAMTDVPEGNLKVALATTMKAYIDAGTFWNIYVTRESEFGFVRFEDEEREKFKDYKIPWDSGSYAKAETVREFWAFATVSLAVAEELIKRETAKP